MEAAKSSKIFSRMAEVGTDFVSSRFGEVGRKMVLLFEVLGNHPEIDNVFFEDQDLDFCELLEMVRRFPKEALSGRLPLVAETIVSPKFKSSKEPGKNGYAARLLRKPVRDRVRSEKRTQIVSSKCFSQRLEKHWHSFPSSFGNFTKNSERSRHQIFECAESKFRDMGCEFLCSSLLDIFDRLYRPKSSFGYKKIGVSDTCGILAKMQGLSPKGISLCLIPLHLVRVIPQKVSDSVQNAEFNSSLFHDATFDHYFVAASFPSSDTMDSERCSSLVENRNVRSALLGERDGECFFICEWS